MGNPKTITTPHLPLPTEGDAAAKPKRNGKKAAAVELNPQATAPAHPVTEVQTAAPGEAPESLPNPTSHGHGEKGGPTNPSLDTTKFDDLGNEKLDPSKHGPRGKNMPADVLTDAERQVNADAAEKKLQAGLAPTNKIDSVGAQKGSFKITPQGHDKHGARLPDEVDTSEVVEPVPAHVGPRGVGAPPDSFHGARPEKK